MTCDQKQGYMLWTHSLGGNILDGLSHSVTAVQNPAHARPSEDESAS